MKFYDQRLNKMVKISYLVQFKVLSVSNKNLKFKLK